ncbi:hypothetical protein Pelo_18035 [Pelomyxa schiedti]|nr:hypothetical protein Pelo_18035 [Pelomyxa schiedti]
MVSRGPDPGQPSRPPEREARPPRTGIPAACATPGDKSCGVWATSAPSSGSPPPRAPALPVLAHGTRTDTPRRNLYPTPGRRTDPSDSPRTNQADLPSGTKYTVRSVEVIPWYRQLLLAKDPPVD